jgi:hypothetical protein
MLATDFSPLRLSTCELPERERVPTWREQFCRPCYGLIPSRRKDFRFIPRSRVAGAA